MDLTHRTEAVQLHGQITPIPGGQLYLVSVVKNVHTDPSPDHAFFVCGQSFVPEGFPIYFVLQSESSDFTPVNALRVVLPNSLSHIEDGDIVRINGATGEVLVLFKASFSSNSILLTERCNSWCVMCSQPPRKQNDDWIVDEWIQTIPLIPKDTESIGITGGEPTLLGRRFLDLIAALKSNLPSTAVHVLSNGRNFSYLSLAKALSEIKHPSLTVAIPLYSDIAWRHEFVVQSHRSFDQTVRGILNLARCGISIEIRVVLHRFTISRLKELAAYISRNFPFVAHVALMGLEPIGFARTNYDALWVDPVDYSSELIETVDELLQNNIPFSIFNHQLCTLPQQLWPFTVQSISDWKNIYLDECFSCVVKEQCGGFFHSSATKHSRAISSIKVQL